jgi:radical SAM superfamily enzyme YgiQ (UPF0313 family)
MFVVASRGCPFQCTFCPQSVFGHKVRYRQPEEVVEEIQRLVINWHIKEAYFQDDTLNMNRSWLEKMLNLIIDTGLNKKVVLRAPLRVNKNLLDIELLQLMRRAGFWTIFYGVESGNQEILDRAKKGVILEDIERAFRLTKQAGIKPIASFIIGLPGETAQTIQDSISLWKRIKPYYTGFNRAIPYPGTEFEKEVKQKGHLLVSGYNEFNMGKTLVRTDALTGEELENYAKMLDRMVKYERIRHLLKDPVGIFRAEKFVLASKFRRYDD